MTLDPKAGTSLTKPDGITDGLSGISGGNRITRVAVILGKPRPKTPASDAAPEAGRDVSKAIVVCTAPDVCKTPIGSSTPPIPYQITGKLGDDASTSQNVFLTGLKAFKFDSVVTHVTGDEPGTATGIKSGTVGDIAEPKTASSVVRVNGQWLVRDGDTFWMNKRNTVGELIYKKDRGKYWSSEDGAAIDDSEVQALLAKAQAQGAIIETYETEREKTGKARITTAASATGYASLVRTALGEKPILLAQAQPLPNAPVTDVPNPTIPQTRPNPVFQPGPAANDNIFKPSTPPDLKSPYEPSLLRPMGWAGIIMVILSMEGDTPVDLRLLGPRPGPDADPVEREIDQKARDALGPFQSTDARRQIKEWRDTELERYRASKVKAASPQPQPQPQPQATPNPTPQPDAGVRVEGKPDPCNPGAHGKNECPPGQDSHHIIADYILRLGTRKAPGARVPGAPSLDEGPAICLSEDEHREVHRLMDNAIRAAGGASGTVPFEKVKQIAYDALGKAKPDCKGKFEAATDEFFKKISNDALVRAYKSASKAVKAAAREALKAAGWPIE
ncbi:PAAR-like domain-containing protein [Variovorax sp. ZT5P49]|uniref:DUF4150 domain-containing protein n=1 Tax=Variovorax sp. ZT5P49 TaxID=3443733 RepID=UPI003F448520